MLQSYNLNLRHLYAAITIARVGSISRAAEEIHISQPALTHAIRKLEAKLKVQIFERCSQGVKTTEAGWLFLAHAEDAMAYLSAAAQQLRQNQKLKPLITPELHITTTHLRAFLAVLRVGGYMSAARVLEFSQPSIYRAVKELQFFLGVPLFETSGRLVRATEAAERFGAQVQLTLASIQSGIDELASLHEPSFGRIQVGSLPLPRSALLPNLLAAFSETYKKAFITIVEGQYRELIAQLRNGAIDMMFGALRAEFIFSDLEQFPLFVDELCVVCRQDHPLKKSPLDPTTLAQYPWVVAAEKSPTQSIWRTFMNASGGGLPTQWMQCSSILLAKELIRKGDWLALMSPHQFRLEEDYGILARLNLPVPGSKRPIGLTIRKGWRPTFIQQSFLKMAKEMAGLLSADAELAS